MSRIIARLLSRATVSLAGLLFFAAVATVHAQNIAISKDLCGPAGCISQSQNTLPSVPPYTPVSYPITLYNNNATALNVDLQETFQPGFHFTSSTCGLATPPLPSAGGSTFFGPLPLPPMTTTTCVIYGYFEYLPTSQNSATNTVTVYASADTQHLTALGSSTINATVNGTAALPTDLSVAKVATVTSTDPNTGAVTVHYTITITNNGPNDAYGFLLQDRLSVPATGVPLTATYGSATCTIVPGSGTSTCFDPVPSVSNSPLTVSSTNPTDFLQWSYPAGTTGLLKAGDSMVIAFDVTISALSGLHCVKNLQGNFLTNAAHISFNVPGSTTTIQDANPNNNTATASVPVTINAPVDPTCGSPALQVTKTQDTPQTSGGFAWGSTIGYTITLTNNSTTQTIDNIQLFDSINGSLGDLVQAGVGTPPFTAQLVSSTCLPAVCTNSQAPTGNTQQVTGYGDTQWMFGTTVDAPPNIAGLAPGATVSFQLQIKYSNPGCDSYPDVALKPVINFVRASYQDPALGNVVVQSPPVTANMQAPPACQFTVQKSVDNGLGRIAFATPSASYTVTFGNPTPQVATIGTLIDSLRIVPSNYATQLPVAYSYSCTASPSGSVTGFPGPGTGSVTAIQTSLPQQGVRIIQNTGPVTFQPQSTLACTVTITVSRPSAGDTNCSRVGQLENVAIMDTSAFYNSNLPWPSGTNPGYAAKVALPLPQCLNLVVNKSVNPIWTTQNTGPLNYTLTVTNLGDPIVATDGLTLSDNFTPSNYAASLPWQAYCVPATSSCTPTPWWVPNPTANPSTLHVNNLNNNQAVVTKFPVKRPYPPPPGNVCNHAEATVTSLAAADWYAKDPSTWTTDLCAPIFDARPLDITKTVTVTPPATTPPAALFPVTVVCSFIQNGVQYGPSTTVTFNYPTNLGQTVTNIPVGSACTVTEQQPLPPPVAMASCPSGFGAWGPVTYPNPGGQSLTIVTTAPNRLEVHNTFACVPVGTLSVTKTFDPSSPASQFPATAIFPVSVACTGLPTTTVNLQSPNFQQTVPNIAMGSVCTITELTPTGTNVQPNCHWDTSYPKGQSVTIPNGSANLEAHNALRCTGTLTVYKTFDPVSLGTSMPATALFPILIACLPGSSTTVNLSSSNQFKFQTPSMPVGTVCTITELPPLNAPIPSNCQWKPTTYIKGQSVTIPNGTSSLVAQNSLTCGPPLPTGTLTVYKTFDPASLGTSMPVTALFPIQIACAPGSTTTVNLSSGNQFKYVTPSLPAGTVCTLTELPPLNAPIPANCQWKPTTYPKLTNVTIPGNSTSSLVAQNSLTCSTSASLTVRKTTTNLSPIQMPNPQFPVTVSCPSGPSTTLSLTANAAGQVAGNIPVGGTCTITETPPPLLPPIPANCQWVTSLIWGGASHPNGSQIQNVQGLPDPRGIEVHNDFVCNTLPTGTLTVKKTIIYDTMDWTNHQMGDFQVVVSCANPASVQTITLTHANNYQATALNLPVGAQCIIVETLPQVPNPLPPGEQWVATYVAGQQATIQAGNQTLPLKNLWVENTVPPGQAQLQVTKYFSIYGLSDTSHTMTFQVVASCTGANGLPLGTSPMTANLTPNDAMGWDASIGLITYEATANFTVPVGSTCTINEPTLPPLSANLATCSWATGFPTYGNDDYGPSGYHTGPTVSLNVSQQASALIVENTLLCPPFLVVPPSGPGKARAPAIQPIQTRSCPPGTTPRGSDCVQAMACRAPLVANAAGNACICPAGLVQRGAECVRPVAACAAPLVPGAAAGSCVCPQGTVLQGRECVRPQQHACAPPLVPGAAAGSCVCPQGTVLQGRECVKPQQYACAPPLVPGAAAGSCVCPQGTVLQGRECVQPQQHACAPPLVPGAAAGSCLCPQGTVLQGRECVRPQQHACTPPLVPGAAAGSCVCPQGTVLQGRECVPQRAAPQLPFGLPNPEAPSVPRSGGQPAPAGTK